MSSFVLNHQNAAFRLCIGFTEDGRIAGQVFSQRLTKPMPFTDIGSFLLKAEDVLELQNFPQAFQRARSFQPKEIHSDYAACNAADGMSADTVINARGQKATIDIYVVTRRNSTWQGHIDWTDGTARQEFSSDLDMIRLIDERLFG